MALIAGHLVGQADDLEPPRVILPVEPHQRGRRVVTGRTPGPEHVHQHHLAAEARVVLRDDRARRDPGKANRNGAVVSALVISVGALRCGAPVLRTAIQGVCGPRCPRGTRRAACRRGARPSAGRRTSRRSAPGRSCRPARCRRNDRSRRCWRSACLRARRARSGARTRAGSSRNRRRRSRPTGPRARPARASPATARARRGTGITRGPRLPTLR